MPCQSGASRVQGEILNHWPAATYNAGCFNPHSFNDGGKTPSAHQRGEAVDIGIVQQYRGRGSIGQVIFVWLYANRGRLGLTQLIWDGQGAFASSGWNIHPYLSNPHRDHIHVQFTPSAARNPGLSALPFSGVSKPTEKPKPKQEEEDVFRVIRGDQKPDMWLTNWLEKRRIGDPKEVDAIIQAGVTNGAPPVKWPQAWVDQIPVST